MPGAAPRRGPRLSAALRTLDRTARPVRARGTDATVVSAWTRVGDLRIHARVARDGAPAHARDVVLLHGVVVSSRYMVPLALELAGDVRAHAPDLPGFGLSDKTIEPLDVGGLADALLAWMDAAGLANAVLVANSFGCQVAIEAVARQPGRFDRVVLQGPAFDPCAAHRVAHLWRWLRTGVHEPPGLNAILVRDLADCGPSRGLATIRHALADRIEPKLARIDVATLVVRGGADRVCSQQWVEEIAGALPHGDLITLPGVAHALNFSAAPQLAAIVRRFLDTPARRRERRTRGPERSIAAFDSATAMLRASSRALRGRGMEGVGAVPRALAPAAERLVQPVNRLPRSWREEVYRRGSGAEGIAPAKLHTVDTERVAAWMAGCHPAGRRYPAAIVGSSSGALAHLAAALGVPFLPQTVLVPVRQPEVEPDDPHRGLREARGAAQLLLDANPEIQLHHMQDPNQDRLTLARMAYFRVKRRRLGPALERFLTESLPPGATLFVADCRLRWPVTRVGDRHVFQFGALGGMEPEEFRRRWDAPAPDADAPEAEWGFEPALLDDLRDAAARQRLRLRHIVFDDPEDLSPLVADLHRWWYRRRRCDGNRLLVESFVLVDPWWAIRTATVPLWLKFAVEPSAARLERYLGEAEPYDDVRLALMSHGTEGEGVASIDRWRAVLRRGAGHSGFVGVDERRFPRDFASFGRFARELRAIDDAQAPPSPLTLPELDEFLASRERDDGVTWR